MCNVETMKRADIHSGYVVKLRSGELRMAIRAGSFSKILIAADGRWTYLSSGWDERLNAASYRFPVNHQQTATKSRSDDIVEVYGLTKGTDNYRLALALTTEGRELLWTRNPAQRMTLEEIEAALGHAVEIVSFKEE